jgi:hypothetical protein
VFETPESTQKNQHNIRLNDGVVCERVFNESKMRAIPKEEDAVGRLAVATGASTFLVVTLQRLGHRVVNHEAHLIQSFIFDATSLQNVKRT